MMTMKQWGISAVIAVSFFVGAGVAFADFSKTDWEFSKEITFPVAIAERTLVSLELDRVVLGKTTQNDVRIISNEGVETPFVTREARAEQILESFAPRMQNLSSVPGSHTSFVLDFGQSALHNEITLETPSKNFRKNVQIEGSNDNASWQTLVSKAIIYDYTLEFVAHDTHVAYPESTFRYLRVTVRGPDAPIVITRATARRMVSQGGKGNIYEVTPALKEAGKTTEVVVDLGNRGILTERADISISGQDFERQVSIYGSDDATSWTSLGNDVIYSYKTSRLEGAKTSILWRGARMQYLKFVIINNDNQPLRVTDAKLYGPAQEIVFLADSGQSYHLFYGNPRAIAPTYDFSAVSRYFAGETTLHAGLGGETGNSDYVAPKPPVPPVSERIPYLIPTILGVLMIGLSFLIYNLFKQTSK